MQLILNCYNFFHLSFLLSVAKADSSCSSAQNKIRVLRNIISRIKPNEVNESMKLMLQKVSDKIDS